VTRHPAAHIAHPALKIIQTAICSCRTAAMLFDRQTIDGAFSLEDRVSPSDSFDRQRSRCQSASLKKSCAGHVPNTGRVPDQGLGQWNGFAGLSIPIIEPGIG
jgi:hypothetical protein